MCLLSIDESYRGFIQKKVEAFEGERKRIFVSSLVFFQ